MAFHHDMKTSTGVDWLTCDCVQYQTYLIRLSLNQEVHELIYESITLAPCAIYPCHAYQRYYHHTTLASSIDCFFIQRVKPFIQWTGTVQQRVLSEVVFTLYIKVSTLLLLAQRTRLWVLTLEAECVTEVIHESDVNIHSRDDAWQHSYFIYQSIEKKEVIR
jgi:hypothetical protein